VGIATSGTIVTATITGSSSSGSTSLVSTVISSPTLTTVTAPGPTQSGIAADCNEYYVAQCMLFPQPLSIPRTKHS